MTSKQPVQLESLTDGTPITYGVVKPGDAPKDNGVLFIRGGDIKAGNIDRSSLRTISKEVSEQYKRTLLKGGELLVSLVGNPGEVAIVPAELAGANLARQVGLIRLDEKRVNKTYVQYYLRSPQGKGQLAANSLGSVQSVINLKELKKLEIPLPEKGIQDRIANILLTLDEKLQCNHQINQTLEQIAQAIFKSWFVDFEPVKAKIAALEAGGSEEDTLLAAMQAISGKGEAELTRLQAEQPEQYAELRATAELFPSAMQESELGEIPEGWESGLLSDICEFQNGYAFKSKDWSDSGFAVVKIGSVKPAFVDIQSCSYVADKTIAGLERFELFPGDLLVGMTGYPGETGLVPKTENRVFLNQRVGRLKPKQNNLKALLYCNVRDPDFKQYVEGQAHGSAQANVSGKAIGHYPITIPTGSVVEQFSALIDPLLQQKLNLNAEAMSLAITRDTLLPKLLSGEVSAPEIKDPSQEASRHSDIGDGVAFDE